MLLIRCPYCEMERPEVEFRYAGEAHIARPADPSTLTDAEWANYLYMRTNPKGWHVERWRHIHGCGRFFNSVRHTVTDKILATYKAGERQPDLGKVEREAGA
jgi:sarcosine oxidase, subunit delta